MFSKKTKGFSLVETIVGVAVFLLIATSAYQGFVGILNGTKVVRVKTSAINLANEQIEIIRNLPYEDVGIVNGLPAGKIDYEKEVERDGQTYRVLTTIRNIDEEFDGTIGGTPNDLSPADNKLVEVEVSCLNCPTEVPPVILSTRVAPIALETTGNNGALFVQVFDSLGEPLQGADIHIENNQATSTIIIDDVSNNQGMLQIVDAPPGTEAYEITVTKDGYSTEQTFTIGEPANPVPDRPHANVVSGQVTQISFAIDKLSDLTISSKRSTCVAVPYIDFDLYGSKQIGLDVYKYYQSLSTGSSGNLAVNDLEWDTYYFDFTDSSYELAGSNPIIPFSLEPDTDQHIDLIVKNKNPNSLLVQVKDGSTDLPISDAEISLEKDAIQETKFTSRGSMLQTDWSGGSGQTNYTDDTRYFSQNGNIETLNSPGDLTLVNIGGNYVSNGELVSSIFDTGTTTNFYVLNWNPSGQPIEAGADSVRFQIASSPDNTATTTWNYIGPDGSTSSYYTTPGEALSLNHNGDRYIRYKVLLSTADSAYTPTVSDVSFTFSSDCTPSGQAIFDGLSVGEYSVNVSKSGYQNYSLDNLVITDDWSSLEVIMIPEE